MRLRLQQMAADAAAREKKAAQEICDALAAKAAAKSSAKARAKAAKAEAKGTAKAWPKGMSFVKLRRRLSQHLTLPRMSREDGSQPPEWALNLFLNA